MCFWVLQVGRCKTLPPDTATFLHRVLGKAIKVSKSFPNHCQGLYNIDGKRSSDRKRDNQLWVEKEAALLGKLKGVFNVGFNHESFLGAEDMLNDDASNVLHAKNI